MKPDLITISANGREERVESACSIGDFLAAHGWKGTQVVVEHNGVILDRKQLGTMMLSAGDRLEVIVPVAGG
jgi:thiamine biosynthesis protein ThiS